MYLAITYQNDMVFPHFGDTKEFIVYEIENNSVKSSKVVPTNGASHIDLIPFLKNLGINALICGGMGTFAYELLTKNGITVYNGVNGSISEALNKYLENKLVFNKDALHNCSHHH